MLFTLVTGYFMYHYGQSIVPFIAFGAAMAGLLMINYEKNKGWVK